MQQKFMMYKGYPLVRSGQTLYLGYMSDPYVVKMVITHETNEMADKIKVYHMSTNGAVTQNAERSSLYEALDIAHAWLEKNDTQKKG